LAAPTSQIQKLARLLRQQGLALIAKVGTIAFNSR